MTGKGMFAVVGVHVTQIGMQSPGVIQHGDVFQYVLLRFMASLVGLPLHLFLLLIPSW